MKLTICFLLFCAAVYAGATTRNFKTANESLETPSSDRISINGLEIVLAKLEQMDRKLVELEFELKQYRASQEKTFSDFANDVSRNISLLLNQSPWLRTYQRTTPRGNEGQGLVQSQERTRLSSTALNKSRMSPRVTSTAAPPQRKTATPTTTTSTATATTAAATTTPKANQPFYSSCKNVPTNESGVFLISVNNASSSFHAYCEQKGGWREEFGSGWLVVQHRFDGSVDFYRNWTEYRDGFGEMDGEVWLGLERIHQLTTARTHELIVEVKDFRGNYGFARYNEFQVGSEAEEYELKSLGSYSGTAGDGLAPNQGTKFSTKDRDHNAVYYDGAWWYGDGYSNLNGRYKKDNGVKSIWWHNFKNGRLTALSFSRMMIREL